MKDGNLILKSTKNDVHYRKTLAGKHKKLKKNETSDPNTEFDQHDDTTEWQILTKNAGFELHDATHVKKNGGMMDNKTRRLWVEADAQGAFTKIKVYCRPKARKAGEATDRQKLLGRRRVEHQKGSSEVIYYPKYWKVGRKTKITISASANPVT